MLYGEVKAEPERRRKNEIKTVVLIGSFFRWHPARRYIN